MRQMAKGLREGQEALWREARAVRRDVKEIKELA